MHRSSKIDGYHSLPRWSQFNHPLEMMKKDMAYTVPKLLGDEVGIGLLKEDAGQKEGPPSASDILKKMSRSEPALLNARSTRSLDNRTRTLPRAASRDTKSLGRGLGGSYVGLFGAEQRNEQWRQTVDLSQFMLNEIKVSVADNHKVIVHAKKEEKTADGGFQRNVFTRHYTLADDVDPNTVKCKMSPKGIMTIEAKRNPDSAASTPTGNPGMPRSQSTNIGDVTAAKRLGRSQSTDGVPNGATAAPPSRGARGGTWRNERPASMSEKSPGTDV